MSHHTYMVGAGVNHQREGAPIGLEAAGAISRAVMMMWDEGYLLRLAQASINMQLYLQPSSVHRGWS